MSKLPIVAIVGRPNTGKSTLFNRLAGGRRAIVSDVPGTTRDHVAAHVDEDDVDYLLIDTGGIGGGSDDKELEDDVSAQSMIAMASADLILFTIDATAELTLSDQSVTEMLRKKRRRHVPVVIVATKCDRPQDIGNMIPELHKLGIAEEIVGVSAIHNVGTDELREAISKQLLALHFTKGEKRESTRGLPKIAIVGKPNVGKSSIVNAMMSDPQRAVSPRLVSPIPGTTRDASDTIITHEGEEFVFIDTAGLRRKANVEEHIESISALKSIQAVEDSDIVILVLDAEQELSKQDKRIASLATQEGKGMLILINKSDLLTSTQKEEKLRSIERDLQFCKFASHLFVSAKTRDGLLKMFPLLQSIIRNRDRRIPTKELHNWYAQAIQSIPSEQLGKAKHVTQAEDRPPTFVLFVKNPRNVKQSDLKYLENNLRRTFGFEGTPIRWTTKEA